MTHTEVEGSECACVRCACHYSQTDAHCTCEDTGTHGAEVMHKNLFDISRVYRWGYYDGLYGVSPTLDTPRYNNGYAMGRAQWNSLIDIARGE